MNENLTRHARSRFQGRGLGWVRVQVLRESATECPKFHTDSTQSSGSGPHTVRHPGQPHNAPMPMKSQFDEFSLGLPIPRPGGDKCVNKPIHFWLPFRSLFGFIQVAACAGNHTENRDPCACHVSKQPATFIPSWKNGSTNSFPSRRRSPGSSTTSRGCHMPRSSWPPRRP